jgi:hypothetical protein
MSKEWFLVFQRRQSQKDEILKALLYLWRKTMQVYFVDPELQDTRPIALATRIMKKVGLPNGFGVSQNTEGRR